VTGKRNATKTQAVRVRVGQQARPSPNKKLVWLSIFPPPDDYTVNNPARTVALLATDKGRGAMKYICLGYFNPEKSAAMTEDEQYAMFDGCFGYDDHLRANGHFVGGEALQLPLELFA
jgi:hypothetical protein